MLNSDMGIHKTLTFAPFFHPSLPPNLSSYDDLRPTKNLAVGIYILIIGEYWIYPVKLCLISSL